MGVVPSPEAQAALQAFGITLHSEFAPLAGGHINQGWVVLGAGPEGTRRYLLQRINPTVFPDGLAVQRNARLVSAFLQRIAPEASLGYLTTKDGAPCCQAPDGAWWRVALFLPGTRPPAEPATLTEVAEVGRAFGRFHRWMAGYDGPALAETLPGFHDSAARLRQLLQAADDDVAGRRGEVTVELQALTARADYADVVPALLADGTLPSRITHNDAKASNVLLDAVSGRARAVVDLDTVMPGTVLHDTGDLLRSLAATTAEDAAERGTVRVESERVEALAEGFFGECGALLTGAEREHFVFSGLLLSWEQAMRFLADYLNGDVYYRTARPGQNLDRARVQLGSLEGLEARRRELEMAVRSTAG